MLEITGIILAVVGIGVSVYFGIRFKRRNSVIQQSQKRTVDSKQTINLEIDTPDQTEVNQEQTDTIKSVQRVNSRKLSNDT